jgi:hypothetical protein
MTASSAPRPYPFAWLLALALLAPLIAPGAGPGAALAGELGLATVPIEPDRLPLPGRLGRLPDGPVQAEDTLRRVAERRAALEREWAQRERACYLRFLVNPCLEALRLDRIAAERQFDALEVAARQAIRQAQAIERNQREASRLAIEPRLPRTPVGPPVD